MCDKDEPSNPLLTPKEEMQFYGVIGDTAERLLEDADYQEEEDDAYVILRYYFESKCRSASGYFGKCCIFCRVR